MSSPKAHGRGLCDVASSQYRSHVKYQQIALFISSKNNFGLNYVEVRNIYGNITFHTLEVFT